jgi:hypothetical protein
LKYKYRDGFAMRIQGKDLCIGCIANTLLDRQEQDKRQVILSHEYMTLGDRNYLRMISKDEGGRSLIFMTMYQGKLLNVSFNLSDADDNIDDEAKTMMETMLNTAQFYG